MTSHLKHHSAHPVAMETLPTLGVGRYFLADGSPCTLPFSRAEFDRAQRAVQQCLGTFHFRTGDQVLVLSLFDECCHFGPIEHALNPFGLVLLSADASFYDAGRTESCLRRFAVTAVIGIDGEVLNGLEANGHDVGQLLGDKVVWARPDAYLRLVELQGFQLRRWFELGPAMAMECVAAAGAHVDRLEWLVEDVDGELVLTSRLPRAVTFDRYPTGIAGRVEYGTCSCGSADPRVFLR